MGPAFIYMVCPDLYVLLRCSKLCSGWSKKVKMLMKDNIVSLFKHLENNRITFPWRQDRWILNIDIFSRDSDLTTSFVRPSVRTYVRTSVRHQNPLIINKSSSVAHQSLISRLLISRSSVVHQSFISRSSVVHQSFISRSSVVHQLSSINFIINDFCSSLARLIATFKRFSLVNFGNLLSI